MWVRSPPPAPAERVERPQRRSRGGNKRLRITGWLLAVFVLTGPWWAFVPMLERGDVFGWTDIGHIVLGAVSMLLVTVVMAEGVR